jgi:hypothetical protein
MLVYQRVKKCFKNWGVVFFLNPQSHPEIQDINSLGTLSSQDTAQSPTSNRAWSIAQEASRSPVNHPSSHGMNRIQKTRAQGPNTSAMGMTKKPKKTSTGWQTYFGKQLKLPVWNNHAPHLPDTFVGLSGCPFLGQFTKQLRGCEALQRRFSPRQFSAETAKTEVVKPWGAPAASTSSARNFYIMNPPW